MKKVTEILQKHFPNTEWTIQKPPAGLSKESYIAESADKKIFIKFDVDTPALHRLAEIRVTPDFLAVDTLHGRAYTIQEFAHGEYPDRAWMNAHITELAKFIQKYQTDEALKKTLADNVTDYHKHMEHELNLLQKDVKNANTSEFGSDKFQLNFTLLKKESAVLTPCSLVPVHADPNYKNMLLTSAGLRMVDWDDIILSDPMRDVALILWWYIEPEKWVSFFEAYGVPVDTNKIYWWVAKRSLAIALWFDKRKQEKETLSYLNDFYHAIHKQPNK